MDIIITYFCGVDNGESSFCKIKDTQFIVFAYCQITHISK
jgi:hypothetical protein